MEGSAPGPVWTGGSLKIGRTSDWGRLSGTVFWVMINNYVESQ